MENNIRCFTAMKKITSQLHAMGDLLFSVDSKTVDKDELSNMGLLIMLRSDDLDKYQAQLSCGFMNEGQEMKGADNT